MDEKKEEKNKILLWMKKNKKMLITIGIISATAVSSIFIVKNWDLITKLFYNNPQSAKDATKVINNDLNIIMKSNLNNELIKPVKTPPSNIDFSGEKYSVTKIGEMMGVSNQNINKRLCANGFQSKCSDGYNISEYGKIYGERAYRERKNGYPCEINIWLKDVIYEIFTEEEMEHRRAFLKQLKETFPNREIEMI